MTRAGVYTTIVATVLLLAMVWMTPTAISFNNSEAEKCREIGMTWVKEAPYGKYGCAVVVPVP